MFPNLEFCLPIRRKAGRKPKNQQQQLDYNQQKPQMEQEQQFKLQQIKHQLLLKQQTSAAGGNQCGELDAPDIE